ncbi:MAG: FFLEELY motif protein [Steroidobacteraceae bacterium]
MPAADRLDELLARKQLLESPAYRAGDFVASLRELRIWQSARLARTYEDFRIVSRYSPAVEFFLSDLYGPQEFTGRNRDLSRAWRYLKRALPAAAMHVLGQAVELDVLTLELDHAMVRALAAAPLTDLTYAAAYRDVDDLASRTRQIDLIVGIGEDLSRIVSRVWLGPLLQAAHVPAHAAGFGELQDFLERGYAAFRKMRGAQSLLQAIRERETRFMHTMLHTPEQPPRAARD